MQDPINITKPSRRSASEKQISDIEKIKKCLRIQKNIIKGILGLCSSNELVSKIPEEGKKNNGELSKKSLKSVHVIPSPYISSTLSVSCSKIGILERSQDIKKVKKRLLALEGLEKSRTSIFNTQARLATSCIELKSTKPQKPYDIWKFHNSIHINSKVFIICGKYQDLKVSLLKRGCIENPNPDSIFFDLKWSRSARVPASISDWQLFNHFPRNVQLTAKWNLCKNLNKQIAKAAKKSSLSFFPRCFKLNDRGFQKFCEYYKIVCALSVMKETEVEPYKHHFEKVASSIQISKRWASRLKANEANDQTDVVMSYDWKILSAIDYRTIGSYYQRSLKGEDIREMFKNAFNELKNADPQFYINGTKNIWIIKPGHKSRGRDISIHTCIRDIYNYTNSTDYCIVQKYIENPLLINSKKFDIRQWVLVSNNDPLVVWIFKECYLRFAVKDYSVCELSNLFTHLTNNSISKKSKDFRSCNIEGCMWDLPTFKKYLITKYDYDAWNEKIYPSIKHIVKRTLLSVGNLGRKNSFELLGYDLMIDSNLNTWLLEINSSPAMDYSTV